LVSPSTEERAAAALRTSSFFLRTERSKRRLQFSAFLSFDLLDAWFFALKSKTKKNVESYFYLLLC
jgi:hypothetical protein